jgi:hypothetical protein
VRLLRGCQQDKLTFIFNLRGAITSIGCWNVSRRIIVGSGKTTYVRFGSGTDIPGCPNDVRFSAIADIKTV